MDGWDKVHDDHPLLRVLREYGLAVAPNGVSLGGNGNSRHATAGAEGVSARYADVGLERECARVRAAAPGSRNDTLNVAALKVGTLVGAGLLGEGVARVALADAGVAAGLDPGEVERTISSGLRKGVSEPRSVVPLGVAGGGVSSPVVALGEGARTGGPGPEGVAGRSWRPVDVGPVASGAQRPLTPSVGARGDQVGMFYRGRVHSVAAESEAGKTWLMLHAVVTELGRGNGCVYIDFEDSVHGVVGRLREMGVAPDVLTSRFGYLNPDSPITAGCNRADLGECLGDLKPTLVVIDGVTDAMALHNLNLKDNTEISKFWGLLPRPLAGSASAPAVVTLDHVVKDSEQRTRYAIGGVHKLNTVSGAAYLLDNVVPFGMGVTGRSAVYVAKDRPGQLRRYCIPEDGQHHFADLQVCSVMHAGDAFVDGVTLSLPKRPDGRPVAMMRRIAEALTKAGAPLPKIGIEDRVTGNRDQIRRALAALVDEGYVDVETRSHGALYHKLVRRFDGP